MESVMTTTEEPRSTVDDLLQEYVRVTAEMNELQLRLKGFHDQRAELVWNIREQGDLTYRQVAELVGLSNARVGQLIIAHDATLGRL